MDVKVCIPDRHELLPTVRDLVSAADEALLCVAFANQAGVHLLEGQLKRLGVSTRTYPIDPLDGLSVGRRVRRATKRAGVTALADLIGLTTSTANRPMLAAGRVVTASGEGPDPMCAIGRVNEVALHARTPHCPVCGRRFTQWFASDLMTQVPRENLTQCKARGTAEGGQTMSEQQGRAARRMRVLSAEEKYQLWLDLVTGSCRRTRPRASGGWTARRLCGSAAPARTPRWRLAGVPSTLLGGLVAYLERLPGTHAPQTISHIAVRLTHFGRHLTAVDPDVSGFAALDRQRHIETYLAVVAKATRRDGAPIAVSERRARIITVNRFLADITEWGWPDAPTRQLLFPRDIPRLPRPLPRYLPADADRRLAAALHASTNRQAATALLVLRATGLRIGELLDLELDCVHEVAGQGAWLKVPLGKLATERMVPLDDDAVALLDTLAELRSPGRPLPHPRHGRPVEFLLTRHGRRVSTAWLRGELHHAAQTAGIDPVVPHQLRHTYATAMVNAGVPLQALMALLGHVSANMSLRYGRLFDATVRADYERALTQAKAHLGGPVLPAAEPALLPIAGDWKDTPAIKARMAGGYCIRTPAQGSCAYANICEHCPNYRSDPTCLPILATQKADAETLAADAHARGWIDEADRHLRLIERLDIVMSNTRAS